MNDIQLYLDLYKNQKAFFHTNITKNYNYRLFILKKLKQAILDSESHIIEALNRDLNKCKFEAFTTEVAVVYRELGHTIKYLKKWSKEKKVISDLLFFPSKNKIIYEPYGTVLIIAPWNYPFQLSLIPLIGAIAAGNTVFLKPSIYSPNTNEICEKIINNVFDKEYAAVVRGGRKETQELLDIPFDYIFFTGSQAIGKLVMQKAAQNLIPITLELGGKSPVIIDETANIKHACKAIVWGKFLNAGQSCVAPDYIYVSEKLKDKLISELISVIRKFAGDNPQKNYSLIINEKHVNRLVQLLDKDKIIYGGKISYENRYIGPTIMSNIDWEDRVMQEEIFGPILPILTYNDIKDVIDVLHNKAKPLSIYIFSNNKKMVSKLLHELSSGNVCVNNTMFQQASKYLPFGGVGHSGMGSYHGKHSFNTFSHKKSVMTFNSKFSVNFTYPDSRIPLKLLKWLVK